MHAWPTIRNLCVQRKFVSLSDPMLLSRMSLSSLFPCRSGFKLRTRRKRGDSPSAADERIRKQSSHQHLLVERAGRVKGGHGSCRDAVTKNDDDRRTPPQELEPKGRLPKGERAAARRTRCASNNQLSATVPRRQEQVRPWPQVNRGGRPLRNPIGAQAARQATREAECMRRRA